MVRKPQSLSQVSLTMIAESPMCNMKGLPFALFSVRISSDPPLFISRPVICIKDRPIYYQLTQVSTSGVKY